MKPYPRADRIGVAIQTALSELLSRKMQDPRIEMATISSVKVTSDLRVAYIYFTQFGGEKQVAQAMEGFKSSHGYIKRMIAPKLGLKYMPEIRFIHDTSFDYGARIDSLLNEVTGKKADAPRDGEAPSPEDATPDEASDLAKKHSSAASSEDQASDGQ